MVEIYSSAADDRSSHDLSRRRTMRIFWQSFVDASVNAPYMALLADCLNNIAAPGTTVHVEGISPPDREFGRLAELRCAVQAIDNGIAADEQGFDAFVMGHFQDPGLY